MKDYDEDNYAVPDRPTGEIKAGLPATTVGSRVITDYDPGVAMEVCERVAEGALLKDVLDLPRMPTRASWYRWLLMYGDLHKGFERALKVSAFHMEERMLEKADRLMDGDAAKNTFELDQLKAGISQLRWSAARRDPGRYGERAVQNTVVPIQINTSLDMSGLAKGTESVYHIEAIRPVVSEPQDGEDNMDEPRSTRLEKAEFTKRPAPTPPRHKTAAQTAKTAAAYARRERNKKERKNAGIRTRAG